MLDAFLDHWTPIRLVVAPQPSASTPDAVALSVELARWRLQAKAAWLDRPIAGTHADLLKRSDSSFAALVDADPSTAGPNGARVFWIHLYNALVARIVLERGRNWDIYRRYACTVAGHPFTADAIEHGVLRGNRGHRLLPGPAFGPEDPRRRFVLPLDPRIHAALHCGQESCPPVQIHHPDTLAAELDAALENLLRADTVLDRSRHRCSVHSVLYDYRRDFASKSELLERALRAVGEEGDPDAWALVGRRGGPTTGL